MASPQTEKGYTKIANELLDAIVATPLPDNEHRMLLFIIRKTYGYNKKQDRISLTQFEKALKRSRPVISKTLKNLIIRNMVVRTPLLVISLEKDYEKWVVAPPLLVKNKSKYGSPAPTFASSPAPTHKRKIKEITKDIPVRATTSPDTNDLFKLFYSTINPNINFANKTERAAAEWLITHYGLEKIIAAAKYAIGVQNDKYAPTITTPLQLKDKMAALVKYKTSNAKESKTLIL